MLKNKIYNLFQLDLKTINNSKTLIFLIKKWRSSFELTTLLNLWSNLFISLTFLIAQDIYLHFNDSSYPTGPAASTSLSISKPLIITYTPLFREPNTFFSGTNRRHKKFQFLRELNDKYKIIIVAWIFVSYLESCSLQRWAPRCWILSCRVCRVSELWRTPAYPKEINILMLRFFFYSCILFCIYSTIRAGFIYLKVEPGGFTFSTINAVIPFWCDSGSVFA